MNKKFILIIIIILAIIIGIVLITKNPQIEEDARNDIKTEELTLNEKRAILVCNKLTRNGWEDRCLAVVKKDFSLCTGLLSDKYQDELCYRAVATAKADPSLCEKIEISKYRCYSEVVKTKPDISLCDKVTKESSKNKCYWNIAEKKQDFSFCENITDENWKKRCLAVIKSDSLLCDKIDNQLDRNRCYLDIAIQNNDNSLCKKMDEVERDKERKQNTQTECMAIVDKDESLCEKINRQTEKESCYFGVAVEKNDDFLCEKTGISKDECYWNVALNIINLSIAPF